MKNTYIGSPSQLYGVEEMRLVGGKGDGMRFYRVRNGLGLSFSVSCDRAADLSRLEFDGYNFGFFAPCGYVSPQYFDPKGEGFLKSFTGGFLTTCGLSNVGEPCHDDGEDLPLHGTVSHIPAQNVRYEITPEKIVIYATVLDASAFGKSLVLEREYHVSLLRNEIVLRDRVRNTGLDPVPFQILYHFNVGYPLLTEDTVLTIPSKHVAPRNDHAATGINAWSKMEKPQKGYEEMCFYHTMEKVAKVSVFSPAIQKGFLMEYDTAQLPCFTEWKMMGERDYVLGVEPGNAYPDGRDVMREKGMLTYLDAGEVQEKTIRLAFLRKEDL